MGYELRMESTPFRLDYHTRNAKVEIQQPAADLDIRREKGGWTADSKPIRVQIDTFEARKSYGMKSVRTVIEEQAQEGRQKAYEAIGKMVEEGNRMMDIHLDKNPIPSIAASRVDGSYDTMMVFIPSTGPEISWQSNELNQNYKMDRLHFEWRVNKPQVDYQRGKVEFQVGEYNALQVNWIKNDE